MGTPPMVRRVAFGRIQIRIQACALRRSFLSLVSARVLMLSVGGVGDRGDDGSLGAQGKKRAVGRVAGRDKQMATFCSQQRLRGCLLPSASEPPTYAAGLGQTGDTGSFRALDSMKPPAFRQQSRRGGPLRGRPLAGTVVGVPAGPAEGPCYGVDVGITDSGGDVGFFSGGLRGDPHDGRPFMQLENSLSERESRPEAGFLWRKRR